MHAWLHAQNIPVYEELERLKIIVATRCILTYRRAGIVKNSIKPM
jgi:hypothetical protein